MTLGSACRTVSLCALLAGGAYADEDRLLLGQVMVRQPDGTRSRAEGAHIAIQRMLPTRPVQPDGWYAIWLAPEIPQGEALSFRIDHPGFAVYAPAASEAPLPADLGTSPLSFELLPKGSAELLTPHAMEKLAYELTRRTKEQIPLQNRAVRIEFARYLKEWGAEFGFQTDQIKSELDKWIASPEARKSDSNRTALAEFLKRNFERAAKSAAESAAGHEKRAKQANADSPLRRQLAARDHRLSGDAWFAQYRFMEAATAYTNALSNLPTERATLQTAAVQLDLAQALLHAAVRAKPEDAQKLATQVLDKIQAARATCPLEALCWEPGFADALQVTALKIRHQMRKEGSANLLPAIAGSQEAALDARLRNRILDDLRPRGESDMQREAFAWRRYAQQTFADVLDLAPRPDAAPEDTASWLTMLRNAERDYGDTIRRYGGEEDMADLLARLEAIYQDQLFAFESAFALNEQRLKRTPNDLAAIAEFAEKHFTVARYRETLDRTDALVKSSNYAEGIRCGLRAIRIAALVGLRDVDQAASEVKDLVTRIEAQPASFQTGWSFVGTRYFIEHHADFTNNKGPLLLILAALERDNRDAILRELKTIDLKSLWVPDSPG